MYAYVHTTNRQRKRREYLSPVQRAIYKVFVTMCWATNSLHMLWIMLVECLNEHAERLLVEYFCERTKDNIRRKHHVHAVHQNIFDGVNL